MECVLFSCAFCSFDFFFQNEEIYLLVEFRKSLSYAAGIDQRVLYILLSSVNISVGVFPEMWIRGWLTFFLIVFVTLANTLHARVQPAVLEQMHYMNISTVWVSENSLNSYCFTSVKVIILLNYSNMKNVFESKYGHVYFWCCCSMFVYRCVCVCVYVAEHPFFRPGGCVSQATPAEENHTHLIKPCLGAI